MNSRAPVAYQPQGITLGPGLFLAIVLMQSIFLIATAVLMTIIVARPELVQRWLEPAGSTVVRAEAVPRLVSRAEPAPRVANVDRIAVARPESGARVALDFTRPIQVVAGAPTKVDLRLVPSGGYRGSLLLTVKGLPNGTAIAGAARHGTDTWLLDGSRELNLVVTVPVSAQGPFDLELELRTADGELFFSEATSIIAMPDTRQGSSDQLDVVSALYQLDMARSLLKSGDIASARTMLQKASERGNAQAAFELAQSFQHVTDGSGLTRSDKQRAMYWYLEARRLGHSDAGARFGALLNDNTPAAPERDAKK